MTVETPSQTIYINNLNEKVKIPALKQALAAMFAQFGEIIDVVAYKNLRSRGQAWVVFKDMSSAAHAIDAMQGFEFYDKPMRIQFAKSKSDAVAKMEGAFQKRPRLPKGEKHKRLGIKEGAQQVPQGQAMPGAMAPTMGAVPGMMPHMPYSYMQGPPPGMAGMPGQAQQPGQVTAPYMHGPPPQGVPTGPPPAMMPQGVPQGPPPGYGAQPMQPQGIPQGPPPGMAMGMGMGAAPYMQQPARPAAPAENPPNHILLLTGLPEHATDKMLYDMFNIYPGLREVRVIPGRHDIAFVEYGTEDQAAVAKGALDGHALTPTDSMRVQFAKKGAA